MIKIPRKLKKKLKECILKGKDPRWKTSEVRVKQIETMPEYRLQRYRRANNPWPILNQTVVLSFSLGKW